MALTDPVGDNVVLAVGLLALYVGSFYVAVFPYLDGGGVPSWALWTAGPIALYAAFSLFSGSTYELWGTVSHGVVLVSLVTFLFSLPHRQVELPLAWWRHATLLLPVAAYVTFRVGRLVYLVRTEDREAAVPY